MRETQDILSSGASSSALEHDGKRTAVIVVRTVVYNYLTVLDEYYSQQVLHTMKKLNSSHLVDTAVPLRYLQIIYYLVASWSNG